MLPQDNPSKSGRSLDNAAGLGPIMEGAPFKDAPSGEPPSPVPSPHSTHATASRVVKGEVSQGRLFLFVGKTTSFFVVTGGGRHTALLWSSGPSMLCLRLGFRLPWQ